MFIILTVLSQGCKWSLNSYVLGHWIAMFAYEFLRFWAMDSNCYFELLGFWAFDCNFTYGLGHGLHFPYEFLGFWALVAVSLWIPWASKDGWQCSLYEFAWFWAMGDNFPYAFLGLWATDHNFPYKLLGCGPRMHVLPMNSWGLGPWRIVSHGDS